MKKERVKKPRFRRPVWGFIGWFLLTTLILTVMGIPDAVVEEIGAGLPFGIFMILGGLVALLIFFLTYRREGFKGCLGGNIPLGLKLELPEFIYIALSTIYIGMAPTLVTTAISLQAGITEEIWFRAIPIAYLIRAWRFDEKKIPVIAVITAALFALTHAGNVLAGAPVKSTVFQVACCFCSGIVAAAVYIRCGSILPCMVLHFLQDFVALLNTASVSESGVMTEISFTPDIIFDCVVSPILLAIGIYYLRKAKRGEAMELWKKKWSYGEEPAPEQPEPQA